MRSGCCSRKGCPRPTYYRKTDEVPPRISIIDVITVITGKSTRHAAEQLGRLVGRYPEVAANCGLLKFPGRRQRDTAITDAKGIVEVIMLLPGAQAARVRRRAAELLVRHFFCVKVWAGDAVNCKHITPGSSYGDWSFDTPRLTQIALTS